MRRTVVIAAIVVALGACSLVVSTSGVSDGTGVDAATEPVPVDSGCGDRLTSADHCGACGHSCLGATCASGICAPDVLASNMRGVRLAVESSYAYFLDEQPGISLRRVKTSGGIVESFPMQCGNPWPEFAVSAKYAFYGCNTVMWRHRTSDLAVDGAYDYVAPLRPEQVVNGTFLFNRNGSIYRAPEDRLDASTSVKSISFANLRTIRATGTDAFYIVQGDAGTLGHVDIDSGVGGPIFASYRPRALAVDDASVAWADETDGGMVSWLPLTGGKPSSVAALINAVAIAGDYVYLALPGAAPSAGSIVRLRRDGSEPALELARGEQGPLALAIDDAYVYWTTAGPTPTPKSGELRRVAR